MLNINKHVTDAGLDPVPPRPFDGRVDKNVSCLSSLLSGVKGLNSRQNSSHDIPVKMAEKQVSQELLHHLFRVSFPSLLSSQVVSQFNDYM